ncbi:MAG: ABC transporter [Desulfobacterales bacterium]|nr:MAG: ABC transporter [Desulfobacterales bacterium]
MIRLDGVSYRYAFHETAAIDHVSLEAGPGEIVLVTGASGCGKSTLIRLVNGLCPHFFNGTVTGTITVNGTKTVDSSIQKIAQDVGTVFQDPELQFFALQVEDELAFAHEWRGTPREEISDIIQESAAAMGISEFLDASIHDLSEGQKQKLAIASALSLNPKVLVFDEPTANLDPESTLELAQQLIELQRQGLAILVVDHRLYWLEDIATKVVVMEAGKIVQEGDFSILHDNSFCKHYGLRKSRVTDCRKQLTSTPDNETLIVKDLVFNYKKSMWRGSSRKEKKVFSGVSFSFGPGITAIIGDNGQGKTTLARLLTGLLKMQHGSIELSGQQITARDILNLSSIVLQNTDHQLHMNTVSKELEMAAGYGLSGTVHEEMLKQLLVEINLDHLADRHPQSLSGGEKQRLVIACGLAKKPKILILDEPTSGLDGGNMQRIISIIRRAADQGSIILLITHDLELLEQVAERALHLPIPPSGNEISV